MTRTHRSQSVGCAASWPTVGPVVPAPLALGVGRSLGRDGLARGGRGRRRSRPPRRCRASPAARDRAASARAGWCVIRTFASWALPIVLLFRRPSSATSTCSRSSSSSSQRASRCSSSHRGSGSGNSARWTLERPVAAGGPVIPRLLGGVRDDRGQQPGQVRRAAVASTNWAARRSGPAGASA